VIVVDLLSVGVVLAVAVVNAIDTIRDRLDPNHLKRRPTTLSGCMRPTRSSSPRRRPRRPQSDEVRTAVERISGIDTELSFAVAERYDTITEVKYATEDDFRRIHDIRPQ
jgi:hypothetical protein